MRNHTRARIHNAKSRNMHISADQCLEPPRPSPTQKHTSAPHQHYLRAFPLEAAEVWRDCGGGEGPLSYTVSVIPINYSRRPSNIDKAISISPKQRGLISLLQRRARNTVEYTRLHRLLQYFIQAQSYPIILIGFMFPPMLSSCITL